jgi:hypothetical protein
MKIKRPISEATSAEIEQLAAGVWRKAAKSALTHGAAITGRQKDKIIKTYPDGRTEQLGNSAPRVPVEASTPGKRVRRSSKYGQRIA